MSRTLEIVVISGENLQINRRSVKNANVSVQIRTESCSYQGVWSEKLEVELPMQARCLILEAECKSSSGAKKLIGMARIPVTDFIGDYTPENYLHFLSYRLRDKNGERNGIVNLSVRVKAPAAAPAPAAYSCSSAQVVLGIPVVTGVPVW